MQAENMSSLKPMLTARHLPSTAPITDAHPLMPHAQGTRLGNCLAMTLSPDGNGHPRKKETKESNRTDRAILAPKDQPMAI